MLLTLTLAACGGDGGDRDMAAAMPQDTFIKPIEREPLTDADLTGFTMAEMALEIPWTRNKVTRDAAPGAAPSEVHGADVSAHDGFDRVTFSFGEGAVLPGYQVQILEAGSAVECGEETHTLDAARTLAMTFTPARASDGGDTWVPTRVRNTSASRMSRAGVLCDAGDSVTWIADLAEGDQLRILELRDPIRVILDAR